MAATLDDVMTAVSDIRKDVTKQGESIASLQTRVEQKSNPNNAAIGAPAIRQGESALTSRGYSFLKLVGFCSGVLSGNQCKVELELHNRLQKGVVEGSPYVKAEANSILSPMSTRHMVGAEGADPDPRLISEIRQMVRAGLDGYDPEGVLHLRKSFSPQMQRDLSWIDTTAGGALVAPPVMGELIDILRNNEALMLAGARDIGMPPQGRIAFPRQTGTSTGYWVGENETITNSDIATGDVVLMAKKLGILVKIPNELFRFATVSAEALVREDIGKVMALTLDKALLESPGSTVKPKGLLAYSGILSHTSAGAATNGDTLQPEDINDMIGKVEEQNADFKAFIGRPRMYGKIRNRRADAVTAADGKGMFLFDVTRSAKDSMERGRGMADLEGYPFVKSTNVSNTRVKGSGTNLTYLLGGDFADMLIALSGIVEFLVANQGDTMIQKDQTWVRGIQLCDGAPRREASFIYCDNLLVA